MKFLKFGFIALIIMIPLLFFAIRGIHSLINPNYYINTSSQAVVKEMRALNRYETASFTIEKIIDAGTNGNDLQQLLFGDKLLLIAHGEVIAGFDLSTISTENVTINQSTISVTLPQPKILITKLDNDQTRVYDRQTGILTHGDKDLESKARATAELSIQRAACQEHILDEASTNARNQLTSFLKALGFTTVILNIPQGSC